MASPHTYYFIAFYFAKKLLILGQYSCKPQTFG